MRGSGELSRTHGAPRRRWATAAHKRNETLEPHAAQTRERNAIHSTENCVLITMMCLVLHGDPAKRIGGAGSRKNSSTVENNINNISVTFMCKNTIFQLTFSPSSGTPTPAPSLKGCARQNQVVHADWSGDGEQRGHGRGQMK